MVPLIRDRSSHTTLHAMRGLVREGVPHLSRRSVCTAHHERVTAGVIKTLKTTT